MAIIYTGKNVSVTVNGKKLAYAANVNWTTLSDFELKWSNSYFFRAEAMASRFRREGVRPEITYNHIFRLCELLWKLKVLKL